MSKNFVKRVLSGVQPTGGLHIGNYLGAIKNFVDMQNDGGIITLTPSGTEDRERGTNLMYDMMSLFESQGAVQ